MTLSRFNTHVWLTEVELEGYSVRGAIVIDGHDMIVLDTLSHPYDMTPLLPLTRGKRLTIIYTHADWDHVWGTGLPYMSARIIGQTTCLERFTTDVPQTLHARQSTAPQAWEAVELIPPTETFQHETSLSCGALTLTLHHLPGHTRDSLVAFLPHYGIVFMGDTVETPFPCLEPHSPLSPWLSELQRWQRNPQVRHVIPAHGAIGGREIIQQNITYLQRLVRGESIDIPEPLTEFYRETHQENLRIASMRQTACDTGAVDDHPGMRSSACNTCKACFKNSAYACGTASRSSSYTVLLS